MLFLMIINASFTGLIILLIQRSKKFFEQIDESFAKFNNSF